MSKLIIDSKSETRYWVDENNNLHRKHGPAIEYTNGSKQWFTEGRQVYVHYDGIMSGTITFAVKIDVDGETIVTTDVAYPKDYYKPGGSICQTKKRSKS